MNKISQKLSKKTSTKRQYAEKQGRFYEKLATLYLRLKGYQILAERFKTPLGEIDIIARKGRYLICVEVKYRRNQSDFINAISPKQQRRLLHGAELVLAHYAPNGGQDIRVDVIYLTSLRWPRHLQNAIVY